LLRDHVVMLPTGATVAAVFGVIPANSALVWLVAATAS
jgi:hypothetical protein